MCFEPGAGIRMSPCLHVFHGACIQEWFRASRSTSCPVCRRSVAPATSEEARALFAREMQAHYTRVAALRKELAAQAGASREKHRAQLEIQTRAFEIGQRKAEAALDRRVANEKLKVLTSVRGKLDKIRFMPLTAEVLRNVASESLEAKRSRRAAIARQSSLAREHEDARQQKRICVRGL